MAEHRSYAGLVSRIVGLIIDVLILTIGCLAVATLPTLAWQQIIGDPPDWVVAGAALAAALLPWSYFTVWWWLTGRTIGAIVVGVVVLRNNGTHLHLVGAALRAAGGLILWPVWLLGLTSVLTDARRRAWHDRLFRTVVRYAVHH